MRIAFCGRLLLALFLAAAVTGSLPCGVLAEGASPSEGRESSGDAQAVPRFLTLPFVEGSGTLSQGWIYTSFKDGQFHGGTDWSLDPGTPILAAADGVAMASRQWQYGNFVVVKHDNGYFSFYAHLEQAVPALKHYPEAERANTSYDDWTPVQRGDVIGYCGKDGAMGGNSPHLHFEVRTSSWGRQPDIVIDPFGVYGQAKSYPPQTEITPSSRYMWTTSPPSGSGSDNSLASLSAREPSSGSESPDGSITTVSEADDGSAAVEAIAPLTAEEVALGLVCPVSVLSVRETAALSLYPHVPGLGLAALQ